MGASRHDFLPHVLDLLAPMGPLQVARFFGGHGLRLRGAQFAMVMDDALYLRVDEATRPNFEARGSRPFAYSTRRGSVQVRSYFAVPEDLLDEPLELLAWAQRAAAGVRA